LLHRSDAGACRACGGSTALRDDAVLGDGRPKSPPKRAPSACRPRRRAQRACLASIDSLVTGSQVLYWSRVPGRARSRPLRGSGGHCAQLKACRRWGKEEPHDLSLIRHPVLLANGDDDRMLPTPNTLDMARRVPNNELVIYPDAGHAGIFQFHEQFVEKALEFLGK